jgi:hypothetical protein
MNEYSAVGCAPLTVKDNRNNPIEIQIVRTDKKDDNAGKNTGQLPKNSRFYGRFYRQQPQRNTAQLFKRIFIP